MMIIKKNQSALTDLNNKELRSIEGGREWTVGRIARFIWFIFFICFILGLVAFYLGIKDGERNKHLIREKKSGLVIEFVKSDL